MPTKGAKEQACFEREEFRSVVGPSVNRSERAWMNDKLMRTASNPGNIGEREGEEKHKEHDRESSTTNHKGSSERWKSGSKVR